MRKTGILQVPFDPADIRWSDFFEGARELDLYFAYAKSWRGLHERKLRKLATTPNAKIRVVLPDPHNEDLILQMAPAYKKTPDELKQRILDAYKDFDGYRKESVESGASIKIYYTEKYPTFSYYRFNRVCVIALYSLGKEKASVPHIVSKKGGSLYDFGLRQYEALLASEFEQCREV